jgi:anti-sigma regulatory factor (Ser/Thr protein kinase)
MFVTCLYVLLDPVTGDVRYANAGHNVPYLCSASGVTEMRARGMPLGLLPDMAYEELTATIEPGSQVIMYSDGLVEAHNAQKEIFGFPRLRELLTDPHTGGEPIQCLLDALNEFVGPDWEQEDDVTFVSLARESDPAEGAGEAEGRDPQVQRPLPPHDIRWRKLAAFELPSQPGNERQAMERVAETVSGERGLSQARMDRLKTAVAEATMNAMEHGNQYHPDLPVGIEVLASPHSLAVRITDHGGSPSEIPASQEPNLEAKLAGLQSPRGWGLFLIKSMVDEMRVEQFDDHHTVELILHLEENPT